jgi:hypothetical protein
LFYWRFQDVFAVRKGPYKAHFTTLASFSGQPPERHANPLLFNLDIDPSEQFDIAEQHPEVIAELTDLVAAHKKTIAPAVNQLNIYPPGQAPNERGDEKTDLRISSDLGGALFGEPASAYGIWRWPFRDPSYTASSQTESASSRIWVRERATPFRSTKKER